MLRAPTSHILGISFRNDVFNGDWIGWELTCGFSTTIKRVTTQADDDLRLSFRRQVRLANSFDCNLSEINDTFYTSELRMDTCTCVRYMHVRPYYVQRGIPRDAEGLGFPQLCNVPGSKGYLASKKLSLQFNVQLSLFSLLVM